MTDTRLEYCWLSSVCSLWYFTLLSGSYNMFIESKNYDISVRWRLFDMVFLSKISGLLTTTQGVGNRVGYVTKTPTVNDVSVKIFILWQEPFKEK